MIIIHPIHVQYNNFRAIIGIEKFEMIDGNLPPRVLGLVIEWAELHQVELKANWENLIKTGHYSKIAPLV